MTRLETSSGLYVLVGGAITAFFALLGPIIGKLLQRGSESRQDRRVDFESMLTAMDKILDASQEEAKNCREETHAAREERDAMQDVIDKLRRQLHQANETLALWAIEFNRQPVRFDENGEAR